MRVLQINSVAYGSTARIMFSIADAVIQDGGTGREFVGFTWKRSNRSDCKIITSLPAKAFHKYLSYIDGREGYYSTFQTKRLIHYINLFNPDIIQLHNLHGWFLNYRILFDYFKSANIPIVWTLHDCWSFTGHCPHYDMIQCDKWKTLCHNCTLYPFYPATKKDNSEKMYNLKKDAFCGVKNLTVVTPSCWLRDQVKMSYLSSYNVQVINNGIDLSVFKPVYDSDIKEKYGINSNHIILGVAFDWTANKGLDVFIELSEGLPADYKVVLVGTDEETEKSLPDSIISIRKTDNVNELAALYSAADVFVNPTFEDTFPTVNIEALACGTPIVTFNTGGSPEIINDACGIVVEKNDVRSMINAIKDICTEHLFSSEDCVKRASRFNERQQIQEYIKLYKELINERTAKNGV